MTLGGILINEANKLLISEVIKNFLICSSTIIDKKPIKVYINKCLDL